MLYVEGIILEQQLHSLVQSVLMNIKREACTQHAHTKLLWTYNHCPTLTQGGDQKDQQGQGTAERALEGG